MGGEVLVGALMAAAMLALLAVLRRERREGQANIQRPGFVTLAYFLLVGSALWLAGNALLTAVNSS